MSLAARKFSCESIFELYVFQYDYACDSRSNFGEDGINDTFEIFKNGPTISNCDKVVKLFVDSYYRSQKKQNYWHFVIKDMAMLFKNLGLWLNWYSQAICQFWTKVLFICVFLASC